MKPQTIGRAMGIGLRVAGRIAGQRLAGSAQPTAATAIGADQPRSDGGRAAGRTAARATVQAGRGVKQGIGGFLRPFRRVGGTIWLEVVGVFFLLPVVVFTPILWQTRTDWVQGPDHRKFVSSAVVVSVFLYLGVTSFLRARKRSRV